MFDILFLCLLFGSCIGCNVPNFPSQSIVNAWRYNGAREKCFCGYSTYTDIDSLSKVCPSWYKYVSTDNQTANKVHQLGVATVLGSTINNLTLSRYGQMTDWSVDFGSGYNNDCNKTLTPNCLPRGSHVLSIPSNEYYQDCCTMDNNQTPSLAQTLLTHPLKICTILKNLIQGGLSQINHKKVQYDSCKSENQNPILNGTSTCLAQCFHYRPDVNWVHLHSTAGVYHMRNGPIDSGLGLGYNVTESQNAKAAYGKYNVCVCEPSSWGPRRGNCPTAQPYETGYAKEATKSLCQNVAGVAGIDVSLCNQCDL